MNAGKRIYPFQDSGAGVWHTYSRILDRQYLLSPDYKDFILKTIRAYEDLLGVEVLTFCIMDNHFHLLLRVPHRPEGLDVPLEVILARMERAVGEHAMKLVRRDLRFWETTGNREAIEAWRQRQMKRMYSMPEFMGCVKQRFTRWHNAKSGRRGTIWEERYGSVIVEEEERALRAMAAYIDLNPVRAGMVSDPADYRWSGYAEAMAGKARARRGLVRIIGGAAWPKMTMEELRVAQGRREGEMASECRDQGSNAAARLDGRMPRGDLKSRGPWGDEPFPAIVERRALVFYRALLGGQGAERKRADGRVVRRGVSEKVRERLTTPNERRLTAEILTKRVQHFTRGMIIGSRAFIDDWFEANRSVVSGRSRTERKRGSRSLARPALRGIYSLRDPGRC